MKVALFASLATVAFSGSVLAASSGVIVSKRSGGGNTPREWSNFETCEVFTDKLVHTKTFASGAVVVKEEHAITVSGSMSFADVVAKAKEEILDSSDNFMCDAPSTEIVAFATAADNSSSEVLLFSTGGCGGQRLERSGAYTYILTSLVDKYCPTTIGSQRD